MLCCVRAYCVIVVMIAGSNTVLPFNLSSVMPKLVSSDTVPLGVVNVLGDTTGVTVTGVGVALGLHEADSMVRLCGVYICIVQADVQHVQFTPFSKFFSDPLCFIFACSTFN